MKLDLIWFRFVDKLLSTYFYFLMLWRKLRSLCCGNFFSFFLRYFASAHLVIARSASPGKFGLFLRFFFSSKVETVIWKKIITVIDATFAVAKRKLEKNSGLYVIRTLDLCDTGAASNPVQAWIFFRLSFRNCKICIYNCDDLLSCNSSPAVLIYYFHIFII